MKKKLINKETGNEKSSVKSKNALDKTLLLVTLILCASAILLALGSAGVAYRKAQQDILELSKINQTSTLDFYSKLVNAQLESIQKDIKHIEVLIQNDEQVFVANFADLSKIQEIIEKNLPDNIGVHLFLAGQYQLNKDIYPPINFASQKQLLVSENSETSLPEFYTNSKGNYFSLAKSIRNPNTNELLYSVLVSYPADILFKYFPKNTLDNTQISLIQSFEQGSEQLIFSLGTALKNTASASQNTSHPAWKFQYRSNQQHLLSQAFIAIAINLVISVLLMLGAILFCIRVVHKNLVSDASLIFEFINNPNQKSIQENVFKTSAFNNLYQQIRTLDIQPGATKKRTSFTSSEADNFDINIASGDENLLGGERELGTGSAASTQSIQSVTINPSIFRAYDIRGIVGETLTPQVVKLIGQAIGTEVLNIGESAVIVARDGRLSGPELSEALCEGILSSGANIIDIGMVPTPVLYFACKTSDVRSGVMLTGSHNPSNHNGLKIVINGVTLASEAIQKLHKNIESKNLSQGEGHRSTKNVVPAYIDVIENDVILAQPLNIVIDCGNGVAGVIAEKLFKQIGCNVTMLYGNVDGNFPNHHPDPSRPDNLRDLIAKVKETGADLGIAFDGDGDRLGVVTNKGKIIWPDRLMMLFSRDILLRNPGADIIFDVKCSNTLAETIRKQGGRPLMWKTGHSLIKAKLSESGAQLAGEMSGHIFFNDRWYGFDDGLYSAARLLEILSTESKSCDEIFAEFPEMVSTPEINIAVADEVKFDIISVLAGLGDFGGGNKTDIDGIRIDYTDGWGLIRASNTSANLVTRFEAKTSARLAEIQAVFKAQILKIQSDLEIPF